MYFKMYGDFDEQSSEIEVLKTEMLQIEASFEKIKMAHEATFYALGRKITKLRAKLQVENSEHHYVYVCLVNGVVRYIGKGSGERWRHCASGMSSCKELNADYFKYGKENMLTIKASSNLTKEKAEALEAALTYGFQNYQKVPIYNKKIDLSNFELGDDEMAQYVFCSALNCVAEPENKPSWWAAMVNNYTLHPEDPADHSLTNEVEHFEDPDKWDRDNVW